MPRLIDGESRTDEIVRGICRLVVARGLEALTLRNIAAEVGISAGTLTHHYASRRRLLRVAAYRFGRAFVGEIAARRWQDGPLAFLPASPDELAATRVWLAWSELGRTSSEIDLQLAEARADERALLGTTVTPPLTNDVLDSAHALLQGLRAAICCAEGAMPLDRARTLLADAVGVADAA